MNGLGYETEVKGIFCREFRSNLKDAVNERSFREEALLLAKVAKTCRTVLFKNGITSSGKFNEGRQDILPVVHQLIFLILYGPNIHGAVSHTRPIKTLSQLVVHNLKIERSFQKPLRTFAIHRR